MYFPEVIFDDFLEPSFWGPRWRFGAHGDQKVSRKEPKGSQKRENSDSAEPWFLDDPIVVLLHYRVPGGSGGALFAHFFWDLSREGVWRGTFQDLFGFGAIWTSIGGPFGVDFLSFSGSQNLCDFRLLLG